MENMQRKLAFHKREAEKIQVPVADKILRYIE